MIHDFETGNFLTNLNVESRSSVPIEQLDRQIGQLKTKLRRVREAYEAGVYTLEEFADSRQKIEAEIARLNEEKNPVPQDKEQLKAEFLRRNRKFLNAFLDPKTTPEEKNAALHRYVDKIVFNRNTNHFDVFYKL